MTHLNEGCQAPLFRFKDECGKEKSLADFRGKKIILYFYPKDLTPGCVRQACDLRDNYNSLLKNGFIILGISADSEARHKKFSSKFNLPFHLIADTDYTICNLYGVFGSKSFFGIPFKGILRTTFIIDEEGKIENIIHQVKTNSHSSQIIESLNNKN